MEIISFTGKDKEIVERFVGMLKENNIPYRVSIEEDIDSISEFEEEIGKGMIVVIFYSPDYFKSYHCMNEYALECVSWYDCMDFIIRLNELMKYKKYQFRLPTEAEWEYAARSGGKSWTDDAESLLIWRRKNDKDLLKRFAFFGNIIGGPQPVGQLYPNSLGIYDMSGNVWEWCQDWFANYSSNPVTNPQVLINGSPYRVLRGGSWGSDALNCRVSSRYRHSPDNRNFVDGFRLLLSSQKKDKE